MFKPLKSFNPMSIVYIFSVTIGVLALWSLWGYFSSHVEQAEYTVLKEEKEYEIRHYPDLIAAQTSIQGNYDESLNDGFSIIAGYIFGGNKKKETIAMTAPVKEQGSVSETIAMTAPVKADIDGEIHTISFVMPKSYTLESLPMPNDSRVSLVQVPAQKMAVLRFSGFRSSARVQEKKEALLAALERDGVEVIGAPQYAGYNAPWTPPWMTRNEIMIQIK